MTYLLLLVAAIILLGLTIKIFVKYPAISILPLIAVIYYLSNNQVSDNIKIYWWILIAILISNVIFSIFTAIIKAKEKARINKKRKPVGEYPDGNPSITQPPPQMNPIQNYPQWEYAEINFEKIEERISGQMTYNIGYYEIKVKSINGEHVAYRTDINESSFGGPPQYIFDWLMTNGFEPAPQSFGYFGNFRRRIPSDQPAQSANQTISNQAPNHGAQGVFYGPVSFGSTGRGDDQSK